MSSVITETDRASSQYVLRNRLDYDPATDELRYRYGTGDERTVLVLEFADTGVPRTTRVRDEVKGNYIPTEEFLDQITEEISLEPETVQQTVKEYVVAERGYSPG